MDILNMIFPCPPDPRECNTGAGDRTSLLPFGDRDPAPGYSSTACVASQFRNEFYGMQFAAFLYPVALDTARLARSLALHATGHTAAFATGPLVPALLG